MSTAVCHTPECENQDLPIEVETSYVDDDGNTQEVSFVVCGPCGQVIEDVIDAETTPAEEGSS